MTWRFGVQLPEAFDFLHRQIVTAQIAARRKGTCCRARRRERSNRGRSSAACRDYAATRSRKGRRPFPRSPAEAPSVPIETPAPHPCTTRAPRQPRAKEFQDSSSSGFYKQIDQELEPLVLLLLAFGKSTVRGIGDSQVATNRFILNRENRAMNQPVLLHIVERLEGFLGKLPASIQRPILNDLTPLKELFLQQRSPRFLLLGSNKVSVADLAATIFRPPETGEMMTAALSLFRWQQITFEKHGTISWLDARGADDAALSQIHEELKSQPADIFFFFIRIPIPRAPRDANWILPRHPSMQANDAAGTARARDRPSLWLNRFVFPPGTRSLARPRSVRPPLHQIFKRS